VAWADFGQSDELFGLAGLQNSIGTTPIMPLPTNSGRQFTTERRRNSHGVVP